MRRRSFLAAILIGGLTFCGAARAEDAKAAPKPFVHPLFQNDMVLQRDVADPIWGWTEPGKQVTVSINGKSVTATADAEGKWMTKLEPLPAGGPFDLTISGPQEVKITNVLIGDVWVCSGQSNMEMGIRGVGNAADEIKSADYPKIRLFTLPKKITYVPQEISPADHGKWLLCTPDNVGQGGGFSAVGYFFGREIEKQTGIPIGLIHTSWGGTPAQAWVSAEALGTMPDFTATLAHAKEVGDNERAGKPIPQPDNNPNAATVLYDGMINPLLPFAIKGALWYQGESNAGGWMQYRTLLPTLIRDWRARFGVGEFPFYIVQLAAFMPESETPQESDWAGLREAQALTAATVGHSGIAVLTDIGNATNIHPTNKQEVGRRLALNALAHEYGKDVEYAGPTFKSMKIDGANVTLQFDHLGGGLEAKGGDLKGFAVAGADHKYQWANAKIEGDTVVLTSPDVAAPVSVRYAWANNPVKANLYNKAGLPAGPFRTDVPK